MEMDKLKKKGKILAVAGAAAFIVGVTGCAQYAPASGNTSLANCGQNTCKGMNNCKGKNSCGSMHK